MPTLVDKDFPDYTLYPVEEADEKWVKLNNPLPESYSISLLFKTGNGL